MKNDEKKFKNIKDDEQSEETLEPQEKISFIEKIILLITEPSELFNKIAKNPDWIKPLITYLVFVLLSSALIVLLVVVPNMEEMLAKNPNLNNEQKKEILENPERMKMVKTVSSITGIITPIMGSIISILIITLILYSFASIIGTDSGFKIHLSLISFAQLVNILGMLIRVPLIIIKQDPQLSTSIAMFLPGSQIGTPLYSLCSQIDPFAIWSVILTAIGYGIINRFSKKKSYFIIFGLWVLWLGLVALFGNFFGSFA